jgi:hypothetical protein
LQGGITSAERRPNHPTSPGNYSESDFQVLTNFITDLKLDINHLFREQFTLIKR